MSDDKTPPKDTQDVVVPETPVELPPAPVIAAGTPVVKSIRAAIKDVPIHLACGVLVDGKIYRDILATSIMAGDRKAFGESKNRNNGGKMITDLLTTKVRSFVGAKFPLHQRHLRDMMLSMDRDQITYELRKATVGDRPFEEIMTCVHCSSKNSVSVEAAEIEESFRVMPDDVRLHLDSKGRCYFTVHVPEYGFHADFFYGDGKEQEYMAGTTNDKTNVFDMELHILSRLCLDWNGEGPISAEQLAEMDVDFIERLQDAIRDYEYGYNFTPLASCYSCGRFTKVRVNPLDFLFPKTGLVEPKKRRT
jgi:hypothetical protein